MKSQKYYVCVHLEQETGEVCMTSVAAKAGQGGCWTRWLLAACCCHAIHCWIVQILDWCTLLEISLVPMYFSTGCSQRKLYSNTAGIRNDWWQLHVQCLAALWIYVKMYIKSHWWKHYWWIQYRRLARQPLHLPFKGKDKEKVAPDWPRNTWSHIACQAKLTVLKCGLVINPMDWGKSWWYFDAVGMEWFCCQLSFFSIFCESFRIYAWRKQNGGFMYDYRLEEAKWTITDFIYGLAMV